MNDESKPDRPDPSAEPEPTLRVDEDWKEQVAKEKAAEAEDAATVDGDTVADDVATANDATAADDVGGTDATPSDSASEVAADADASRDATSAAGTPSPAGTSPESSSTAGASPQMPPASFEFLVSMLFTQAMSFLGQIPNPESGETRVDKPMAKHSIDTLDLLTEKTRGNLTDDESRMLSDALHTLRMTYVNARITSD